jgi:cytochrome b subunit of formate dehydrogenase
LCGSCHINPRLHAAVPQVPEYAASVHGRLALGATGSQRPAVCTDCHGIHPQATGHPSELLLPRPQVPGTCGKCHPKEYAEYATSIHGLAALRGDKDAAICTDCHTEHSIQAPTDPRSPVYAANIVATCSKCHANTDIVRLHKLPESRVSSYENTYHGVANRYGDLRVANCVSCHGAHNILPASDPHSTVNPQNVDKTCSHCHPGAQAWMAVGQVHVISTGPEATGLRLVSSIYKLFVFITLAMFFGYILLELLATARDRRRGEPSKQDLGVRLLRQHLQEECMLRLTWCERGQHYLLLVTFVLLSITGVVLLIPDSDVARGILAVTGGMSGRALIHRIAAGGIIVLGVTHIIWISTTERGRQVFRHMLPRWPDLAHVLQTVLYLLGLSTETAKFDRFTFIEKFEYWAVFWGMFSMGVTGTVMTFTDWSLRHLPKWVWEACKIVHTWEAMLAIITIAVWHMYHSFFKPGGPNWSWVAGYLTPEQLAHEHPVEYERIMREIGAPGEDSAESSPEQPDLP